MAVVSAKHVQNHHALALATLQRQGCLSGASSASRFNRRLHALADWFRLLLEPLGEPLASGDCFLIDSLPVPACKRARAGRCRTVRGRAYCGVCPAKREQVRDTRARTGGCTLPVLREPANDPRTRGQGEVALSNSDMVSHGLN